MANLWDLPFFDINKSGSYGATWMSPVEVRIQGDRISGL